ncbi:hypothetical protein MJG53_014451 [Ovis ammon polii x Ovis aries]|uniref:Uncharacterized protein n=1 Tax=Ovis ammon polii x Ovis aries TaxID=2918886 RepID=A0ACB9UHJ1_9CETA|nr:hypothetical protein MJG53_014451 [Ovis ammon polii x Ovis aries]
MDGVGVDGKKEDGGEERGRKEERERREQLRKKRLMKKGGPGPACRTVLKILGQHCVLNMYNTAVLQQHVLGNSILKISLAQPCHLSGRCPEPVREQVSMSLMTAGTLSTPEVADIEVTSLDDSAVFHCLERGTKGGNGINQYLLMNEWKAACQELDGHPSFTEGKRSCGWLPLEGETTGGSLCLGGHQGLSLLICEVGAPGVNTPSPEALSRYRWPHFPHTPWAFGITCPLLGT